MTLDGPMGVEDKYLIDKGSFAYGPDGGLSISHKAVVIFMMGTGVYRLFTRDDFREYFFRIALLYRNYGVLESFFSSDRLFKVISENAAEVIGPAEIARYIGAYAGWPSHPVPFEEWLMQIPKRIKSCTVASLFGGIRFFEQELVEETDIPPYAEGIERSFKFSPRHTPPDEKDIQDARFLADIIVKELPDELFAGWRERFPEAEKEFDRIANRKPQFHFDLEALDDDVKEKIREHMAQFFPGEEFENEMSRALIYLAWLWANGFVYESYDGWHFIDPIYPFDLDQIELEDGGYNIEVSKDLYDLETIFPLLKIDK